MITKHLNISSDLGIHRIRNTVIGCCIVAFQLLNSIIDLFHKLPTHTLNVMYFKSLFNYQTLNCLCKDFLF